MSYTPTEWKTGDIVTSTKLNKLEQGVANAGALVVNISVTDNGDDTYTYTCDKTAGEIYAACPNVLFVMVNPRGLSLVFLINAYGFFEGDGYAFIVFIDEMEANFLAASAEDYPSYTTEGST